MIRLTLINDEALTNGGEALPDRVLREKKEKKNIKEYDQQQSVIMNLQHWHGPQQPFIS